MNFMYGPGLPDKYKQRIISNNLSFFIFIFISAIFSKSFRVYAFLFHLIFENFIFLFLTAITTCLNNLNNSK